MYFRLPLPWFLYSMVFREDVPVSAAGMICSVAILFGMLCLVFISILSFGWKMTKGMGFSMFLLYFVFVAGLTTSKAILCRLRLKKTTTDLFRG